MVEKDLIKFIGKMSKIYETANVNNAYFAEAVRVCESLLQTKTGFYDREILNHLRELIRSNYCIVLSLQEIDNSLKGYKREIDVISSNKIEERVKCVCAEIAKFEEMKRNALANGAFKQYVEPAIDENFRKLMQKNNNKEVEEMVREITQPQKKQSSEDLSAE